MLRFLTRLFALIGFVVVLLIGAGIGFGAYMQDRPTPEPKAIILTLDFDEPIVEQSQASPLDLAIHEGATPLFDILHAIDLAREDGHVKGLVARFGSAQPSLAQAQELRAALARFRASGKFTYAFGASYGDFGLGNKSYYLASAFENIWLQPVGAVGLSGLAMEMPFGKTALEKLGITSDFMQREEYKSAMDNATRDSFAPQVRVEMQGMIDNLADQIASGIAESRKWDVERVKKLMAEGPYTDSEALKKELVTKLGYADDLDKELESKAGKDVAHSSVEDYLAFSHKPDSKKTEPTTVALIYGTGLIVGKAEGAGNISGDRLMGADEIADAFDDATTAKDVKAILFRIDSPGGSPEASETIRHAMIHAQKAGKPVIVSMGSVAASGGYWVAMNADRIVAEPATLTGSIGVIGGKFIIGGVLQKFGVNWDKIKTSENAGMWSVIDDFSPVQKERLNALMDQTYNAFLKGVSDARHIPMEKMPDVAKGRVWTGSQAVKIGLVDELGGYDVALAAVRKSLKLAEKDPVSLETFPAPETPVERVMKFLKGVGLESAVIGPALLEWQSIRVALGPALRNVTHRKPVEMRMPEMLENIR